MRICVCTYVKGRGEKAAHAPHSVNYVLVRACAVFVFVHVHVKHH